MTKKTPFESRSASNKAVAVAVAAVLLVGALQSRKDAWAATSKSASAGKGTPTDALKPALKAIDPSKAQMDTPPPKVEPPSAIPPGGTAGGPMGGAAYRPPPPPANTGAWAGYAPPMVPSGQQPAGYPAAPYGGQPAYYPPQPGYGYPAYQPYAAAPPAYANPYAYQQPGAYPPPQTPYGAPPQAYAYPYGGQPGNPAYRPPAGAYYAAPPYQQYAGPPPQQRPPGYPPQQQQQQQQPPQYAGPNGQPYGPPAQTPAYNAASQAPPYSGVRTGGASPPPQSQFPSADLIPEFGKALPVNASNQGPAQGWTTPPPQQQTGAGPDEQRVTKLEKVAFGSTYPEHEVEDRLDHLEKEIYGSSSSGTVSDRLGRLEQKLGGKGAFSGSRGGEQPQYGGNESGRPKSPTGETPGDSPGGSPKKIASAGAQTNVASLSPMESEDSAGKGKTASDVAAMMVSDRKRGDYFPAVRQFPGETFARWTRFPVRVRLPDELSDELHTSMLDSIEKWGKHIPLSVSGKNQGADIEVSWVNHLAPKFLGVTRLTAFSGHIKVRIYMLRPSYYQPNVSARIFESAFLHEMGHALGIFGHSPVQGDAMFALEVTGAGLGKLSRDRIATLSDRDVNTLRKVYESKSLSTDYSLAAPMEWGSGECGSSEGSESDLS